MRIAFFVNSIDSETPGYTTTHLALAAHRRGHAVVYVTPGDFVLRPDDKLAIRCVEVPEGAYKTTEKLNAAVKAAAAEPATYDAGDIDVLFLRSDPSLRRKSTSMSPASYVAGLAAAALTAACSFSVVL